MSLTQKEITEEKITQHQFDSFIIYLKQEYGSDFLERQSNEELAELINFEFNTLISGEDIEGFDKDYLIEEEDMKLIVKNLGY